MLERDPLPRPQAGRCREDHQCAPTFVELAGDLSELRPGLERALLRPPSLRIVDSVLRRIDVDHSPLDGTVQHLPKRLCRLEAMANRDRHPPRRDLLRTKPSQTLISELAHGLRQKP